MLSEQCESQHNDQCHWPSNSSGRILNSVKRTLFRTYSKTISYWTWRLDSSGFCLDPHTNLAFDFQSSSQSLVPIKAFGIIIFSIIVHLPIHWENSPKIQDSFRQRAIIGSSFVTNLESKELRFQNLNSKSILRIGYSSPISLSLFLFTGFIRRGQSDDKMRFHW